MVSLGFVNLPIKFDEKVIFTLETDINRLFETNIQAAITVLDASILWHDKPYIQHEQINVMKISINVLKELSNNVK